jgi:hypothetical protein
MIARIIHDLQARVMDAAPECHWWSSWAAPPPRQQTERDALSVSEQRANLWYSRRRQA